MQGSHYVRTYSSSLAARRHFQLSDHFVVTPEAQVIYQRIRLPNYRFSGHESNTEMDAFTQNNILGDMGFTLNNTRYNNIHPYFQAHIYQRFNHEGTLQAKEDNYNQTVELQESRTWISTKIGATIDINTNLHAYTNLGYQDDLNQHGHQINGTLGLN